MSVETTVNRISYTGNGSEDTYPYTFKIFEDTDLQVYIDGDLQTLTTHYTVSGAGNDSGGDVEFVTAPANGESIVIVRVLEITQTVSYPENSRFPASVHEGALDRVTMITQQLQETDARALKLEVTSLFSDLTLPDPEGGQYLRWNSLEDGLENADITELGSLGLPIAVVDGGTGAVTALAARQNLGVEGQVVKQLTNRTGASVASGDVVALSTANDSSVVLEDTQGSKRIYAVALETIANLATGKFLMRGVADVSIQGAASLGVYLRKSATSLKAETAGTTQGAANEPPATSLGVTIAAVSGGKATSIWWGVAFPSAAASTIPRGVIGGLTISNNVTDATNDIDIAAGEAASADTVAASRVWLTGTAMTKQIDAVWAAGSAAGGRVGALANGTWHVYVFRRSAGSIDYFMEQSLTPTCPDSGTNYRRIGSILRVAGVIAQFSQNGDEFLWPSPALDVNTATSGTVAVTPTLTVPTGIKLVAFGDTISTTSHIYISSPDVTDLAPSATATPLAHGGPFTTVGSAWRARTNTSGQIRYRATANNVLRLTTQGWLDTRGRND